LKNVIRDGIASQAMGVCTGGVFLVALAVELGASNLVVGFLAAIPPLLQLIQLPAIFLIEKVQNRRAIAVTSAFISRLPWLLVALSAFFLPPQMGLAIVLSSLFVATVAGASHPSGYAWPLDRRPVITSSFGEIRATHIHSGVDLSTGGKTGAPVRAVDDGTIMRLYFSPWGSSFSSTFPFSPLPALKGRCSGLWRLL